MPLTLAQASTIVDVALKTGRDKKFAPLTVAVLDAGGHLIAFKREDKSGILRFDIAFGKAWGALGMGFGGRTLAGRAPNSLEVCTFLDRNSRRLVQTPLEFRCFEIPDRFVVGFGLDYNQLYRNLGYVAVMKP